MKKDNKKTVYVSIDEPGMDDFFYYKRLIEDNSTQEGYEPVRVPFSKFISETLHLHDSIFSHGPSGTVIPFAVYNVEESSGKICRVIFYVHSTVDATVKDEVFKMFKEELEKCDYDPASNIKKLKIEEIAELMKEGPITSFNMNGTMYVV